MFPMGYIYKMDIPKGFLFFPVNRGLSTFLVSLYHAMVLVLLDQLVALYYQ